MQHTSTQYPFQHNKSSLQRQVSPNPTNESIPYRDMNLQQIILLTKSLLTNDFHRQASIEDIRMTHSDTLRGIHGPAEESHDTEGSTIH